MSTKRMFFITGFGVLLIASVIGLMFVSSYLSRDDGIVELPEPAFPSNGQHTGITNPDALNRVEITPETIQNAIATLSRPDSYSRSIFISIFWSGGEIEYNIEATVKGQATSLRSLSSLGDDKRIIITPDAVYIWYRGDSEPYIGSAASPSEWHRFADEWQMLVTYEDILAMDSEHIIEAGYIEHNGEDCLYAVYLSPLLGYRRVYYISIEPGLVVGAQEFDANGNLVYDMSASRPADEVNHDAFVLPDGTVVDTGVMQ